jgi:hypothetical protein
MARQVYFVLHEQGHWTISSETKRYGPFPYRRDALRSAIDWAYSDGREGHQAQVILQRDNDQFKVAWTYGADPYPPPD